MIPTIGSQIRLWIVRLPTFPNLIETKASTLQNPSHKFEYVEVRRPIAAANQQSIIGSSRVGFDKKKF